MGLHKKNSLGDFYDHFAFLCQTLQPNQIQLKILWCFFKLDIKKHNIISTYQTEFRRHSLSCSNLFKTSHRYTFCAFMTKIQFAIQ